MCSAYPNDDGQMDGWMDGWVNGWMDGWVNGWMDGWMDGWMKQNGTIYDFHITFGFFHGHVREALR